MLDTQNANVQPDVAFMALDPKERVIVALDTDYEQALQLAHKLQGRCAWMKVGMTLFYTCGPKIVHELKDLGYKVFLDLKVHDIPHQAQGAMRSLVATQADMLTLHASGGPAMLSQAQVALLDESNRMQLPCPVSLGVTVLTSMNQVGLSAIGVEHTLDKQVKLLASLVNQAGLSGVVASGEEAQALRELLGKDAYIVTPGVRLVCQDAQDQSRVLTPAKALRNGASHVVIGRPITQAQDACGALESVYESIL